jgi:hypothetical protein
MYNAGVPADLQGDLSEILALESENPAARAGFFNWLRGPDLN